MSIPYGQYPDENGSYGAQPQYPQQYPPFSGQSSAPPDPYQQPGAPFSPVVGQPYSGPPATGVPYPPQQPYSGPPAGYPVSGGAGYPPGGGWGTDPMTGLPLSDKSKTTAGLLQLFLGGFGVGRFYTGHTSMAVGQIAAVWGCLIVMICLGAFLVFPLFFCWIGSLWPFIDGIMLLARGGTDAQGRVLRS